MAGEFESWVKANGKWLAIGGAGLLVVAALSGGDEQSVQSQGDGGFDSSSPYDGSSGGDDPGGFDMDKWREEQAADDGRQRERIDKIRDVDRCTDDDGKEYEVPSSIGC